MDTITRNVDDLTALDRQALEHVLGRPLAANQQVLIAVLTQGSNPLGKVAAQTRLLKLLQQTAIHATSAGVTAEAADNAVDEAMQSVRRRTPRS